MKVGMRTDCVYNVKAFLQFFPPNITHFARAGIRHIMATNFQPGGRGEISAWAETRHVIGPLHRLRVVSNFGDRLWGGRNTHTRVCETSPRVASSRNFARARVCISPAP